MTKNHMKARAAPRTWNVERKNETFLARPNPGSQKLDMTQTLGVFLKVIKLGTTSKDINYIMKHEPVLVNGKRRWDYNFGVGFLDVVTVATKHYTLTLDEKGRLAAVSADNGESKLSQATGASKVKGNKMQIHLSDGRNILVAKPIARGTTVQVSIPAGKVLATYPLDVNARVILTAGKHRGQRGTIETISGEFITVKTERASISTKKNYAFVLGGNA